MPEDASRPPTSSRVGERAYCQRCGDTLPPFAPLRALRLPRRSEPAQERTPECPKCGEPGQR